MGRLILVGCGGLFAFRIIQMQYNNEMPKLPGYSFFAHLGIYLLSLAGYTPQTLFVAFVSSIMAGVFLAVLGAGIIIVLSMFSSNN